MAQGVILVLGYVAQGVDGLRLFADGVVDRPAGAAVGLDGLHQAVEAVVLEGGDERFRAAVPGAGFPDTVAVGVVFIAGDVALRVGLRGHAALGVIVVAGLVAQGIGPGRHQPAAGVDDAALVVAVGGDIAQRIGGTQQVAVGVVVIGGHMPQRVLDGFNAIQRMVGVTRDMAERIGFPQHIAAAVVVLGRRPAQRIGLGQLVADGVIGIGRHIAQRIGLFQHIALVVIFVGRAIAEAVGDGFLFGDQVVVIGDLLACRVGVADEPAVRVVLVAHRLDAARVVDFDQAVAVIVLEAGLLVGRIAMLHQVAIAVVAVLMAVAHGIGNRGDAVLAVAGKADARAVGVADAVGVEAQALAVDALHALHAGVLVDDIHAAIRGGVAVLLRVEGVDIGVDKLDGALFAAQAPFGRPDRSEAAEGAGPWAIRQVYGAYAGTIGFPWG